MFHTVILRKKSIEIQTPDGSVVINPHFSHQGTKDHLLAGDKKILGVVCTASNESLDERETFCATKSLPFYRVTQAGEAIGLGAIHLVYYNHDKARYLVIHHDDKFILYDDGIFDVEQVEREEYDLILFDIAEKEELSSALANTLRPRVGVPLDVDQTRGVNFCRQLMQDQACVPKYLLPGQYIVH